MWPNPKFPADLVTLTEEIFNENLPILCSVSWIFNARNNEIFLKHYKQGKDKNHENVPHLEITEVLLIHSNIVNSDYQQLLRVLYIFVPNKSFGQLVDISPKNFLKLFKKFLKTFNSEFSCIKVWFTDQNSKPLEIEGKININLVIN